MNGLYLYRQILKGKWFIHYSYALSLGPLLNNLLNGRSFETGGIQEMNNGSHRPNMFRAAAGPGSIFSFPSFEDAPEGSVALIPLRDVMVKSGDMCIFGTEEIAAMMLKAAASQKINAIVLDIDSGGGSVDAVPPLLSAIKTIQERYNKPVVGCADMCASAAYYVGSHCDRLIAGNDLCAEFGSIGVMMQFWDMVPAYEREGFKFHQIYAPESTHKNLPFEKALKGEYDLIKEEVLSPLAIKFQNDVKAQRGSKLNMKIDGLLNGRMFFASNKKEDSITALQAGLIDEVGDMDRAITLAQSLAEMRKLMKL